MLRTIGKQNKLLTETLKKIVRLNTARALTVECTRIRHHNSQPSLLKHTNKFQWKYNQVRFYALPPHKKVMLPALSPTGETSSLVSWQKKEGDKLSEGDALAEIETDKATMTFETPEEGYLAKIIIPGGTKDVRIGKLICIIVQNQADVAAFKDFKDDGAAAPPPAAPAPAPAPAAAAPARAPAPAPAAAAGPASSAPSVPHSLINLPSLSPTGDTATIVAWSKKVGDKLSEGDALVDIETDKATMTFDTPEEGYLAKIFIPNGTKDAKLGSLMCVIVKKQEDVAAFKDWAGPGAGGAVSAPAAAVSAPAAAVSAPAPASSAPRAAPAVAAGPGGRVFASPLAKRIAQEKGIPLQGKGTGVFDSITLRDLPAAGAVAAAAPSGAPARVPSFTPRAGAPTKAAPSKAAPSKAAAAPSKAAAAPSKAAPGASFIDIPLTSMRATIAKRLVQSKQTIPHYYLTSEIIIDKLMTARAHFNKVMAKEKVKLSVNDFVIKGLAMACKKVPEANAAWMETFIRQYSKVDVSIAVSTDKGLITPIVFNADNKGLVQISKEVKDLAARARSNKLKPQEFQGGTFCISNLGMFGINIFSAVINPPMACILAVGTSSKKLVLDAKSSKGFKEITVMHCTLSADHRVIDGAMGAVWLEAFRKNIEDPLNMIV